MFFSIAFAQSLKQCEHSQSSRWICQSRRSSLTPNTEAELWVIVSDEINVLTMKSSWKQWWSTCFDAFQFRTMKEFTSLGEYHDSSDQQDGFHWQLWKLLDIWTSSLAMMCKKCQHTEHTFPSARTRGGSCLATGCCLLTVHDQLFNRNTWVFEVFVAQW